MKINEIDEALTPAQSTRISAKKGDSTEKEIGSMQGTLASLTARKKSNKPVAEEQITEYLNPVQYTVYLFGKNGKMQRRPTNYENRDDAITYASEMPSIGAVVVGYNRDNNSIKIVRSDFNIDISPKQQKEMKLVALNHCKKECGLTEEQLDEELTALQKMRMASLQTQKEQNTLKTINKTMSAMQKRIRSLSSPEEKDKLQFQFNKLLRRKHDLESNNITESNEGVDHITLDVALFIRCLEWAKESAKDDIALHKFTENAVAKDGILTMADYEDLVPRGEKVEEGLKEDASCGGTSSSSIAVGPVPNLLAKDKRTNYKNKSPKIIKRSSIGDGIYEAEELNKISPKGSTEILGVGDLIKIRNPNSSLYNHKAKVLKILDDKIYVGGKNLITTPFQRKHLELLSKAV